MAFVVFKDKYAGKDDENHRWNRGDGTNKTIDAMANDAKDVTSKIHVLFSWLKRSDNVQDKTNQGKDQKSRGCTLGISITGKSTDKNESNG